MEDLESGERRVLFWNDAIIYSLALSRDDRLLVAAMKTGQVWIFVDWVQLAKYLTAALTLVSS